jgi:hypothetical protein
MFASCGPPGEFRERLDHFIDDASRLSALTSQGVNNEKFGDQLATVRADFDLLDKAWPISYKLRAKHEFELAMQGWQLTYTVWNRSLRRPGDDELDVATNPQLMTDLVIYAGDKLPFLPPDQARAAVETSISFRKTIRMLMTEASNHPLQWRGNGGKDVAHQGYSERLRGDKKSQKSISITFQLAPGAGKIFGVLS